MSELERRLTALAAEIEWPETPPFELRLEPAPARRRAAGAAGSCSRSRSALVAIGIAFAVPPARSAILDFFRIGGVDGRARRRRCRPPRSARSTAGLGAPVEPGGGRGRARRRAFALPASAASRSSTSVNGVVSAVLVDARAACS